MSSLKELTNAYIAVEGLLRSPLLTDATRRGLEFFLIELDKEIVGIIRKRMNHRDDNQNESKAAD